MKLTAQWTVPSKLTLDAAQSDFNDLIDLDDISSAKLSEGAFAQAQTEDLDNAPQ